MGDQPHLLRTYVYWTSS